LQSYQRRRRARVIHVRGEPEGKGTRGTRALPEFRRQVAEQLRAAGHRAMAGPLALDISFVSTRKNPTAIHHMTKWALDALERAESRGEGSAGHRPSLYRNDRQVKLLHVSLRQSWPGDAEAAVSVDPGTYVHAQPLRDVVEDICVAERLSRLESEDDDYPPMDPYDEWYTDPPAPASDPATARVNAFFTAWNAFKSAEQAQTNLLISMDRLVDNAMTSAPHHIAGARHSLTRPAGPRRTPPHLIEQEQQLENQRWNDLISFPLTLPLPGLPEESRERRTFRDALRSNLEAFRRRWPALSALVVPIKITLIVVPPRQGKDLDNLALDVLPPVHEILRPHVEPWLLSPIFHHWSDSNDQDFRTEREDALKRLKSINQQSVTAYQVIELKRMPHHPPSGLLRLTLGLGDGLDHTTRSLWKRADGRMWQHFHRV
jgi:hypothetical protein